MGQFTVYRNPNPETAPWAPYLLTLQSELLDELATVVVAPLVREDRFGKPVAELHPRFVVEEQYVILSTAELAGISRRNLGNEVQSLAAERETVIAALDFLFTGI